MSLVNTRLQPIRTGYYETFSSNDYRRGNYGLMEAGRRGLPQILSAKQISDIMGSYGTDITIPVLKANTGIAIGTTVSCNIALTDNTSDLVTLSFTPYSFGFTMNPAQYYNNSLDYQQVFEKNYREYAQLFDNTLDIAAYNVINTARNQVFPASVSNTYTVTANALRVPLAQQDDFYNNAAWIMKAMNFYAPEFDVAASTPHEALVRRYGAQGTGNGTNLAFQFPGFQFMYSNNIPSGTGVKSTAFIMKPGSFGMFNRNAPDAIMKHKAGDGTEWGITPNAPLIGMDMGYIYKSNCADTSTTYADTMPLTATMVEQYQWYTYVGFITPYTADRTTNSYPIVKAEFLAS